MSAEAFNLVDSQGKVVGKLAVEENGNPFFALNGNDGSAIKMGFRAKECDLVIGSRRNERPHHGPYVELKGAQDALISLDVHKKDASVSVAGSEHPDINRVWLDSTNAGSIVQVIDHESETLIGSNVVLTPEGGKAKL